MLAVVSQNRNWCPGATVHYPNLPAIWPTDFVRFLSSRTKTSDVSPSGWRSGRSIFFICLRST